MTQHTDHATTPCTFLYFFAWFWLPVRSVFNFLIFCIETNIWGEFSPFILFDALLYAAIIVPSLIAAVSLHRFTYLSFRCALISCGFSVGGSVALLISFASNYGYISIPIFLWTLFEVSSNILISRYIFKRFFLFASKPAAPWPIRIIRTLSPALFVSLSLKADGITTQEDRADIQCRSSAYSISPVPLLTGNPRNDQLILKGALADVKKKLGEDILLSRSGEPKTWPEKKQFELATSLHRNSVAMGEIEYLQTVVVPSDRGVKPVPKLSQRELRQVHILQRRVHFHRTAYNLAMLSATGFPCSEEKKKLYQDSMNQSYRIYHYLEDVIFLFYHY